MTEGDIRILVIDDDAMRAAMIEDGLRDAGHARVTVLTDMRQLLRRITEIDPEVIVIDLGNPNRDVLDQMFQVSRSVRRPVAMFVDQSDRASMEAAVDAGVSAYVVNGLRRERVKSVLDLAISRFNAMNRLREELDRTKQALEERKVIDKAKGILMANRSLSEADAYALLRSTAMKESRRMIEVAQGLITAMKLLG
ncbi:ANTAR domain-containing protein [Lichenihabitans sp. Uapishka_5]|uniref:ANTAR domain-containing response regulator n=1 Tax=Lichenihabitans sp. Uapishka_5 TaxID=3037302 RepID=UPI0029E7F8D4|nr:ANTAR domain-containing protein [Lichenihabitans sp. Uapishka_5]MDX7949820.1 ANTAR domain-containing protein [Lichenihabitans sp. Uapishka_5]